MSSAAVTVLSVPAGASLTAVIAIDSVALAVPPLPSLTV